MRADAQLQFVDCCGRSSNKAAARCGLNEPRRGNSGTDAMAELLISGVSRLSGCGSAHPSLSRCISWNRRPCIIPRESSIKTPEVEAVYVTTYETFADVTADLSRCIE